MNALLFLLVVGDPLALRAPHEGRSVSAVLGVPNSSAAFTFENGLGIAAHVHFPLSNVGADVGYKRLWLDDRLQTAIWGGVSVPFLGPDLALDFGLAVHARVHKGPFVGAFGVAAPMVVRLTHALLVRLPVLADVWLGLEFGPVQFGLQGGMGVVLLSAPSPSLALQGSAYVSIAL